MDYEVGREREENRVLCVLGHLLGRHIFIKSSHDQVWDKWKKVCDHRHDAKELISLKSQAQMPNLGGWGCCSVLQL